MDSNQRKRVNFELGAKRTAIPRTKKHRCLRFTHNQIHGSVEKMNAAQIMSLVSLDSNTRLRKLGPVVSDIDELDSPASLLAEAEDESHNLLAIVQRLESVSAKMKTETAKMKTETAKLKKRVADLEGDRIAVSLTVDQGYSVCGRAFADFVVNRFYHCAGVDTFDARDRHSWLQGTGAVAFTKAGGSLEVFGAHIKIDATLLSMVKKLRSFSPSFSRHSCDSFRPVHLAFALKHLSVFSSEDCVLSFFNTCFGMPPERVVELQKSKKLPAKFFTEYKVSS